MKLLAVNTAFREANIGYFDGEKANYKEIDSNCKHAEIVLKSIDEILKEDKITDIDTIAIVVGPGSFTGIRITSALAKGFMVANEKLKAIKISSLDLMSYMYQKEKIDKDYYVALNGLSGNYFVAKYDKNGENLVLPKMVNGEELEKIEKEFVVGLVGEETEFADFEVKMNSEDLLSYALLEAKKGNFVSEENLNPIYLRLSQAEQALKDKEENDR